MDATKQQAIDGLKTQIAYMQNVIAEIEALPDGIPGSIATGSYGFVINIPYDMPTFKATRRALGKSWKLGMRNKVEQTGEVHNLYQKGKMTAWIDLYPEREGATCRRVQVGEKVVPVYEVHCG